MPLSFPLQFRVELDLNGWVDITGDVREDGSVTITRGRKDEASTADPSKMKLTINNRHGRYSPRNPNSPYYGILGRNTRIRMGVVIDGVTWWRFAGEVSEWPARWNTADTDVWVNIKASGILRRLKRSSHPVSSALRRFIEQTDPVVYWPLTNGEQSGTQAPAVVGTSDFRFLVRTTNPGGLTYTRPEWQGGELVPWMDDVVRPAGERGISIGAVTSGTTDTWSVDWVRTGIGGQDTFWIVTEQGGTEVTWFVGEDPTVSPREITVSVRIDEPEESLSQTFLDSAAPSDLFNDRVHHMRLSAEPDGSDTAWTLYLDGSVLLSGTTSDADGTPKPVSSVRFEWWVTTDEEDHLAFGHVTVWGDDAPLVERTVEAMRGWPRERAGRRIERLAGETDVTLQVQGDLDDTPRMGPQGLEQVLELMRQSEEVDGGILHESRSDAALLYRTNRSRYNQEAEV